MEALDGNAIAGLLHELFGRDMTLAAGVCDHCGDERVLAEATVYVRAPGVVVRCRVCGEVLAVLAQVRTVNCVDLSGLRQIAHP